MKYQYAFYLGLCMELAGLIVVFLFIGKEIDEYLEWNGMGIIVAEVFAMGIWIFHLSMAMKRFNREENNDGK